MAIGQRLEIRQGQSLVMTPQLQQAIKLLQLSNLELQSYVESELERNPLLERESGDDARDDRQPDDVRAVETAVESVDRALDRGVEADAPFDSGFENIYADESRADSAARGDAELTGGAVDWSRAGAGGGSGFDSDGVDLDALITRPLTLRDHLEGQLALAVFGPVERLIASWLIDLVEDTGYLPPDLGGAAIHSPSYSRLGDLARLVRSP